jgi:predicted RNA-binding protein YlxR (DUF448 family)
VPERTCVGCRRRRPQAELVRVTLTPDGHAALSRSAAGRGAWLCERDGGLDHDCLDVALRRRGFERAWRRSVPDTALEELRRLRPGGKPAE